MTEERILDEIYRNQNRVLTWIVVGFSVGFSLGWIASWLIGALK